MRFFGSSALMLQIQGQEEAAESEREMIEHYAPCVQQSTPAPDLSAGMSLLECWLPGF